MRARGFDWCHTDPELINQVEKQGEQPQIQRQADRATSWVGVQTK